MADNMVQHMKIKADLIRKQATDSGERISSWQIAERIIDELPDMGRAQAIAAVSKLVEQIPDEPTSHYQHTLFKATGYLKLPTKDGVDYVPGAAASTDEVETVLTRRNRIAKQETYNTDAALRDVQIIKQWTGFDKAKTYNENREAYLAAIGGAARDQIEA
jgi:hypothetical protein